MSSPTILCCRNPVLVPLARNVQIRVKEPPSNNTDAPSLGAATPPTTPSLCPRNDSEFEGAELGQPSLKNDVCGDRCAK
jgi:hypothetical protein